MKTGVEQFIEVTSSLLLFCLVYGMSATVDIQSILAQLHNYKAIGTGLFLQFIILPFLGFLVVKTFGMDHPTGLTLMVLTSSPGGSYSNWWCSVFNADLALSVTMTAISTLVSVVALPINLVIYTHWTYEDDIVSTLNWGKLLFALMIVIVAIAAGLYSSSYFQSTQFHLNANRLGTFAGIVLVIFSAVMSNSDDDSRLWQHEPEFYFGVAFPCACGLVVATAVTTFLGLFKPERVAVSIECVYQNVGIATSVALSMFQGDELALAASVPFYYGMMEAVFLLCYCFAAWKAGWTKAPTDVNVWTMMITSYEVLEHEQPEAVGKDGFVYVEHDSDQTEMTKGAKDQKSTKDDDLDSGFVKLP